MGRLKTAQKGRGRKQTNSPVETKPLADIQFVTVKEFADRCKLSVTFVHTLMDSGTVKSVPFSPPGRQREVRRILKSELERYAKLAGQRPAQ